MEFVVLLVFSLAVIIWLTARSTKEQLKGQHKRYRRSRRRGVEPLPPRFVVVDLETTGLHSDRHEIIEIGAIKVERDGELHATFQTLIKPQKRISRKITELTGLDRKTLMREGNDLAEILPQFIQFCEGLPMVAFNAKFDRSFLEAACATHGHELGCKWTCALELSRKAWPNRNSYCLSEIARDGGLSLDDEHRAIGDCRRTMIVYASAVKEILGELEDANRATTR